MLDAAQLGREGIDGTDEHGHGRVRKFGVVGAPDDPSVPAWIFRTQANNRPVGGAPRCEAGFARRADALPRGTVFWHAFSIWLDGWSAARDETAITQWYHGVPGVGLNPPLVIVARGPRLWALVRHAEDERPATRGDTRVDTVFDVELPDLHGRWLDFVIRARTWPDATQPSFVEVYLDGRRLGRYEGPVGYAFDGAGELPRHGLYPLVNGPRTFDASVPVRRMYLRRSLVLSDRRGALSVEDVLRRLRP